MVAVRAAVTHTLLVPGITYGVMLDRGDLSLHLENDNDKFTVENIRDIRRMGVPTEGPGANRPR